MKELFEPNSIALIGASREEKKVGYQVLKNLLSYPKKVFPINPYAKEILGRGVYSSIKEIKEKIDLVIFTTPAKLIPSLMKGVGEKRVKYALIISGGFKEGGEEGTKLSQEVLKTARRFNLRIIGPNCLGIINPAQNLNATFAKATPQRGNLSFVSQSGALISSFLDYDQKYHFGFSKIVSLGNCLDLGVTDFLAYLGEDKETKAILIYLEGIWEYKGKEFFETAKKVVKKKPIIVLKAGISEEGKQSITFHTGSLAGANIAYQTAFEQAGIIEVKSIEELLDFARVIASPPLPHKDKITVITNAGGPGVLAADACSQEKLRLARIPSNIKEVLPAVRVHNPLDMVGDAKSERYGKAIEVVLKDKGSGTLLVILTPQAVTEVEKTAQEIIDLKKKYPEKTILTSFIGGKEVEKGITLLEGSGITNFADPARAIKVISQLSWYHQKRSEKERFPSFKVDLEKAREIIKDQKILGLSQVKELLALYHIPYVKSKMISCEKELRKVAQEFYFPLVLKIAEPSVLHRTELEGVICNLRNEEALLSAYQKLRRKKIGRLEVQAMKFGEELIIGSTYDLQFGPLLLFGLGGIHTEIFKDTSFSLPPLSRERAEAMIKKIKAYPLLAGYRGKEGVNLSKVVEVILRISQMVQELPIKNIDLNPLITNKKEAVVVDCKIEVNPPTVL